MKKIVLSALLLASIAGTAATTAQAQTMRPRTDKTYLCDYTNPTMNEISPDGPSRFTLSGDLLLRGVETFAAHHGVDQRKVTFAKPKDILGPEPDGTLVIVGTRWEFTINPYGPQCTFAFVREGGDKINFSNCSDGHSRVCTTYFN